MRPPSPPPPTQSPSDPSPGILTSVVVCISSATDNLGPDTDESYEFDVPHDGAGALAADTMFGMYASAFPARLPPHSESHTLFTCCAASRPSPN